MQISALRELVPCSESKDDFHWCLAQRELKEVGSGALPRLPSNVLECTVKIALMKAKNMTLLSDSKALLTLQASQSIKGYQ